MKQAVPIFFGSLLLLTACGSDNEPNTPPEAADDAITVDSATEASIDVLANDTDVDGDELEITDVSTPANGTVSVEGGVVLYTSADGFIGADTFTYTMSDGEAEASAEVTVTVQETLSVSGKVVDEVIPDATVTVTVGGETYTTTANADGDYTLDVPYSNGAELLTISARGAESNGQAFVELVSALPSFNSLRAAAGDDGALDSSESFGTNVTNVTTANYALMLESTDGEAPTDEEALSLAQEAVDATELLEMSAMIKLVIDEGRAMPEGSESVLDFVTKKDSYKAEVEKVKTEDPSALNNMINTIIADDNLVQKKTSASLPSFYIPTQATAPGFVSQSRQVLTFNEDGTGKLVSSEPGATRSFNWTLDDDGFYRIDYTDANGFVSNRYVSGITDDQTIIDACSNAGVSQIPVINVETAREFKLVAEGNRVDMVRQNVSTRTEYDTSSCTGSPVIPDENYDGSFSTAYLNGDELQLIALTEDDVAGTWALNVLGVFSETQAYDRFIPDMVTFSADGSFSAEYSGVTGTWELTDDGALDMFYGGIEQSVEMFNRINGLYGSLMSAEKEDGTQVAVYERVVKQNPDVSLTADDLLTEADEFWFGHINSWTTDSWNEDVGLPKINHYFGWQFKSPTEAYNVRVICDKARYLCEHGVTTQELEVDQQLDWLLKDDGKVAQIDRVDDPVEFGTGDRIRRWHILDVTEDGWVYVLEFDFYDHSPDNGVDDISELGGAYNRINMMELTQFPDGLSH